MTYAELNAPQQLAHFLRAPMTSEPNTMKAVHSAPRNWLSDGRCKSTKLLGLAYWRAESRTA